MKKRRIGWWCVAMVVASAGTADDRAAVPAHPRMGINLAGPADWSTEQPFVDVFRQSRTWVSQKKGAGWGKGPALALDELGWVTKLEPGSFAEAMLCTIQGGHYPAGTYTVLYVGGGKLECGLNAKVKEASPGRMLIEVDSAKGGFSLKIVETNPQDPVRDLRVILPGFEKTYASEPFAPAFLKRWQGFSCLRFMDWMHTNGSEIRTWADRPTPGHQTFSRRGVALETMIDLCNRLKSDAWFCMPHLADDDFVRRFARMVKERLDPSRKVYVEYSNEVWNSQFAQHRHAEEQAKALGLGPKERPWEGAAIFHGRRSVEIFRIWEEVLGSRDRLVRVIAWQAAGGEYWSDRMLLANSDAGKNCDALAIAPYVTMCIGPQTKPPSGEVSTWSLDQVFAHLGTKALPESIGWIRTQKKVADKYGLRLITYEAGQHLVGVGGGENNEALTKLFQAANRDPRMGGIYETYFDAWAAGGGDLMCHFSSLGGWGKWGSWGLAEFEDDHASGSPKYTATLQAARRWGQPVAAP